MTMFFQQLSMITESNSSDADAQPALIPTSLGQQVVSQCHHDQQDQNISVTFPFSILFLILEEQFSAYSFHTSLFQKQEAYFGWPKLSVEVDNLSGTRGFHV